MQRYRYSRWDGTQEIFPARPDDLLDNLVDSFLQNGDLTRALWRMMQHGLVGPQGERIKGIQDMLEQLRRQRQQELNRFNLDSILDELREKLDQIVQKEGGAIDKQLNDLRDILGPGAVEEAKPRRQLQRVKPAGKQEDTAGEDQGQSVLEGMLQDAVDRQSFLESLPRNPAGKIDRLTGYDFLDKEAEREFNELLQQLQGKVLENYFNKMQQQLKGMSPEQMARLKEMMKDLNQLLREKMAGGEPDFEAFKEKYKDFFAGMEDMTLDEFIDQIQRQSAQMQSLLDSLPYNMRQALQPFMDFSFLDDDLRAEMMELAVNMQQLSPMEQFTNKYRFRGNEPLSLDDAFQLMEKLQSMDELEESLRRTQWGAPIDEIDSEQVRELLGEDAHRSLEAMKELTDKLEASGYVQKVGNRFELTPKGLRKIGQKALKDIFKHIKKDQFGRHATGSTGTGRSKTDNTKRYEYGDPFLVDLVRTLLNSLQREANVPISIRPSDFEVYKTEYLSQSSIVLMLDMSGSMERFNKFFAAKKVALALERLINLQFPKDSLQIVGFYSIAQEIKSQDLPYVVPKRFGFSPFAQRGYSMSWGGMRLQVDYEQAVRGDASFPEAFTNIQEGLRLSRKLLERSRNPNKQIIMITDGEPTAHFEDGLLYLEYPPTHKTLTETLKEVVRCTKSKITVNTFMLSRDYYLEKFVDQLTKINRGRAFYTTPDKIGEYVLVDYIAGKKKKII